MTSWVNWISLYQIALLQVYSQKILSCLNQKPIQMDKTLALTFKSKNALLATGAMFFDRLSYYGIRSVLIVYFLDVLSFEQSTVFDVYSYTYLASGFFALVAAIIGDLTSNKTLSIIGFGGMLLSCLFLAVPSEVTAIIGVAFFILFGKASSVQIKSIFAREHQPFEGALDTGFTFLYTTINVAAFLGSLVVGFLCESLSYSIGFIFCVIIYLAASILIFLINSKKVSEVKRTESSSESRWLIPVAIGIFICTFWVVYEFCFSNSYMIFRDLLEGRSDSMFSEQSMPIIQTVSTFLIGALLIVLWAMFKMNSFLKLGTFIHSYR